jgi:hypothetical protein
MGVEAGSRVPDAVQRACRSENRQTNGGAALTVSFTRSMETDQ